MHKLYPQVLHFVKSCLASSPSTSPIIFKRSMSALIPPRKVTLIPGDGIGPEIADATVEIFKAANVPIEWEVANVIVGKEGGLPTNVIDSIKKTKLGLKGPLGTPIGRGHMSLNLALRKEFNLYANVRPCKNIEGVKTPFDNVDVIIMRENTEGEYSGIEHIVKPGIAQSIKLVTKEGSYNISKYAFDYALKNRRKKVTCVHKANIMKLGDGLFVATCREVSRNYPDIFFEEMVIDDACMGLALNPSRFDVMVMPNLYGDIISDMCAGLVGGLGVTPSANIGKEVAIFEAVHGTAPDIAGENKANPMALSLAGVMMLQYLDLNKYAKVIEKAIYDVIAEGKVITLDLGGTALTTEFTAAVVSKIKNSTHS